MEWRRQTTCDEDQRLINNRQNGRRRGRGGGQRSPNNAPQGNRQDNRQRGNAAQLLEKYKSLARDAQLAGDRVQTEYYLQFADHYFRVLNENRSRFEEQRRQRDDFMSDEDEDEDEAIAAEGGDGADGEDEQEQPRRVEAREQREQREPRGDEGQREERGAREQFNGEGRRDRPRRERPRRERSDEVQEANGEERISLEVLPPAIAPAVPVDAGDAPTKAPRRRARRPRPEGEADIAPAA